MSQAKYNFKDTGNLAYIRLVDPSSLPAQVREKTAGMTEIWSIHNGEGVVLALVDDRKKAFNVARMNEMHPVSVH